MRFIILWILALLIISINILKKTELNPIINHYIDYGTREILYSGFQKIIDNKLINESK